MGGPERKLGTGRKLLPDIPTVLTQAGQPVEGRCSQIILRGLVFASDWMAFRASRLLAPTNLATGVDETRN
jgi:hypothetical protein